MEQKDPYSCYLEIMGKLPTDIYGLKFRPTLQPQVDDDRDWAMMSLWGQPDINGWPGPVNEVSDENYAICEKVVKTLGDCCKVIVEIGVNRNGDRSMTQAFLKNKLDSCIYFGIDIVDKSPLNYFEKNIHTIVADSFEQDRIRKSMKSIGIEKIDVLSIDGWHSVNTAINDWKYADMLSENGVVILHDTNIHPGPVCLFEAVDENLFDKQRHCTDYIDYGIATFKKK